MLHTDKEIKAYFRNIFGVHIRHLEPYKIALTHKSVSENTAFGRLNNERLEYLGDAILGAIVADYIYHKYPTEAEGFLTRMRSKLVNRGRLNDLGRKLGLHDMMNIDEHVLSHYANGNALEAVIGAIYLDKGFPKTYSIIMNNVFLRHLDLDAISEEDKDYKSRILIWAQKHKHKLYFHNSSVPEEHNRLYRCQLTMDGVLLSEGIDISVKKAEQAAAEKAIKLTEELNEE